MYGSLSALSGRLQAQHASLSARAGGSGRGPSAATAVAEATVAPGGGGTRGAGVLCVGVRPGSAGPACGTYPRAASATRGGGGGGAVSAAAAALLRGGQVPPPSPSPPWMQQQPASSGSGSYLQGGAPMLHQGSPLVCGVGEEGSGSSVDAFGVDGRASPRNLPQSSSHGRRSPLRACSPVMSRPGSAHRADSCGTGGTGGAGAGGRPVSPQLLQPTASFLSKCSAESAARHVSGGGGGAAGVEEDATLVEAGSSRSSPEPMSPGRVSRVPSNMLDTMLGAYEGLFQYS